jgi:hypothetical protein
MGANSSKVVSAESSGASVKLAISRLSDEYLSFIQTTTVEIGKSFSHAIRSVEDVVLFQI